MVLLVALACAAARAQDDPPFHLVGDSLQRRANAALTLMTFAVTPDLNSSFLSIEAGSGTTANPEVKPCGSR
ncbi:MAG: hypothetical protein ACRERC_15670 [Candidatus Binatia bacterium]